MDYEKVAEDDARVEYLFGAKPVLHRRLLIDKTTLDGHPLDGHRDKAFLAVFFKILREYQARATWPGGGMYAA